MFFALWPCKGQFRTLLTDICYKLRAFTAFVSQRERERVSAANNIQAGTQYTLTPNVDASTLTLQQLQTANTHSLVSRPFSLSFSIDDNSNQPWLSLYSLPPPASLISFCVVRVAVNERCLSPDSAVSMCCTLLCLGCVSAQLPVSWIHRCPGAWLRAILPKYVYMDVCAELAVWFPVSTAAILSDMRWAIRYIITYTNGIIALFRFSNINVQKYVWRYLCGMYYRGKTLTTHTKLAHTASLCEM